MGSVAPISVAKTSAAPHPSAGSRPAHRRAGTSAIYAVVRELVEPMLTDRPLGGDVETVAAELARVCDAATAN